MAKILFVIAPEGYQDLEYENPKKVLEKAGHKVITASTVEVAQGGLGGSTEVDLLLKDADAANYAGVAFIGGPGSHCYFDDPVAHKLAQDFYQAGKLACAICAAPSILANAGLLEGKNATSWAGQGENLKAHGANYTGAPVEKDGLIITASGPPAAVAFGEAMVAALNF